MTREIDDETLMAYADGELEPDAAARVARAVQFDERLAARVALFRRTRETVAADAREHPAEPAPPALVAKVRTLAEREAQAGPATNVRALRAPAAPARTMRRWRLPAAASIALAVGLGAGFLAGRDRAAAPGLQIPTLEEAVLASALTSVASGERTGLPNGAEIAAIASFLGGEGELCREFEYERTDSAVLAVACRDDGHWRVRFAMSGPATPESGYAPASSLETLDAYLSSIGAGQPLSPEDEAAALAAL